MAGLPKHFSMISAQTGPQHDQKAHEALRSDLERHGFKVTETEGHYEHPEKSFMVEHGGSEEDKHKVDKLGRQYRQQSVIHSSFRSTSGKKGTHHNEMRYSDGSPSVHGRGFRQDSNAESHYTIHPKIGKFQLHLDFGDSEDAKKAVQMAGAISTSTGTTATMRVSTPKTSLATIKPAKAPDVSSAKAPTSSPKTLKPSTKLVSAKPKTPKLSMAQKSVTSKFRDDLRKQAYMHQDGETLVDPKSHVAAAGPVPKVLMDWGAKNLVPMKVNDYSELELDGHTIKVTKKSPDLYSGWAERAGDIGHKFEKVTMPQLLMQLQSSLELYGREDQVAGSKEAEVKLPISEFLDEHKKLVDALESPTKEDDKEQLKEQKRELTEVGNAVSEALDESKGLSEADRQAKIREKLEALRAKVKSEEIPAKDLQEGLEDPEETCPACESPAEECSCYEGLSTPRLEFDGRKVTIFFKSDWTPEDKDNFKDDLKRRAGIILRKRDEARSQALQKARKLIDVVRKGKK